MGDYGLSSFFGSAAEGAATEGAAATAAEAGTAASELGASEIGAGAATDVGAGLGESASGFGAGIDPFAGGVGAGVGGAEAGAGVGGEAMARAAEPSFFESMGQLYNSASPYLNTASKIMQAGNMLKNAISGSGAPGTPQTEGAASPAPLATDTPQTPKKQSRDDYIKEQEMYWQNLLAETNPQPGGGLPPNIEDMIRRQASIYPA